MKVYYSELLLKQLTLNTINQSTRGLVHNLLAERYLQLVEVGESDVIDQSIIHTRKAYKVLPSSSTRSTLIDVLLVSISLDVSKEFVGYKKTRNETVKSISDPYLLTLALNRDSNISTWLKNNVKLKEVVKLYEKDVSAFRQLTSISTWALLNTQVPKAAQKITDNIKKSNYRNTVQALSEQLNPLFGGTIVSAYWLNKINGKANFDKVSLDAYVTQGTPLPVNYMQ